MPLPLIATAAIGLAAEFAPDIARWIGGDKAGDVATRVVTTAQTITGSPSTDPNTIAKSLRNNPEFAMQFQSAMMNYSMELERLEYADRENARARDIAIIAAGRRNVRADIMVGGAALILIACLVVLVFMQNEVSGAATGIISTVAGIAGKCLSDAFQYEFGSSRGSQMKTDLLAAK